MEASKNYIQRSIFNGDRSRNQNLSKQYFWHGFESTKKDMINIFSIFILAHVLINLSKHYLSKQGQRLIHPLKHISKLIKISTQRRSGIFGPDFGIQRLSHR